MMLLCVSLEKIPTNLRKYDQVHVAKSQDGWEVETRRRMSGKMEGSLYKVWTNSSGTKFYSLKKAKDAGYKGDAEGDNEESTKPSKRNGKGGKGDKDSKNKKKQKKA